MMKPKFLSFLTALLVGSLLLAGCDTPGEGAKHGAILGAAVGAISERSIEGAAAGAGIGAAAGALTGYIARERRREYYRQEYPQDRRYNEERVSYYESDQRYPMGRPTSRSGYVISPYRPYHTIDVSGIPHGARVVDPSNGRIFINP